MNEKELAFSRFHPVPLFCYFISLMLFTMFTQNPIMLLTALLGGICFNAATNTLKRSVSDLKFYAPMFLIIALTNPLFSHNGATPLFFMNDNPVTLEAILCGVNIAVMLTAVMLLCQSFTKVMESDKLLSLLGGLSPKLCTVLSMALRFIPLFKRKWGEIHDAQASMGYFRRESLTDKLVANARVFSALVTWALENSVDTASSMSARGYGLKGKKSFSLFRFTKKDAVLLLAVGLLSAVTLIGVILGKTYFSFYPVITYISADGVAIASYAAFSVLSFLPFIIEVKEALHWKYLRSKI